MSSKADAWGSLLMIPLPFSYRFPYRLLIVCIWYHPSPLQELPCSVWHCEALNHPLYPSLTCALFIKVNEQILLLPVTFPAALMLLPILSFPFCSFKLYFSLLTSLPFFMPFLPVST